MLDYTTLQVSLLLLVLGREVKAGAIIQLTQIIMCHLTPLLQMLQKSSCFSPCAPTPLQKGVVFVKFTAFCIACCHKKDTSKTPKEIPQAVGVGLLFHMLGLS